LPSGRSNSSVTVAANRSSTRTARVNEDGPGFGDRARSAGKFLTDKNSTTSNVLQKERRVEVELAEEVQDLMGETEIQERDITAARVKASISEIGVGPKSRSSRTHTRSANSTYRREQQTPETDKMLVLDRAYEEGVRAELVQALTSVPNMNPGEDPNAFHGRAFCLQNSDCPIPRIVWRSDKKPRQNSPDWLTATEYKETPAAFDAKIKFFATLLRASRRTMAYTGAGLSVAAGIGMAAVGSKGGAGTGMGVSTAGEPTTAHCVMAELNRQNLLHGWVQQNHDCLPQKAGYRQEDINEIHGSWFDPSNPVVKYSGSLRDDLFVDMEWQAQTADLVIVVGTSLTGLNADQCVTKTAERSCCGEALGSVIISPQRTAQDGRAALRIFAKADDVMIALAKEFGFGPRALGRSRGVTRSADLFPKQLRMLVPYDKHGRRSSTVKTYWDLSDGKKVRMSEHNNLEGANQPMDKGLPSVGVSRGRDARLCSIHFNFSGTGKELGLWWLETAQRGGVEYLPVVNVDAKEFVA